MCTPTAVHTSARLCTWLVQPDASSLQPESCSLQPVACSLQPVSSSLQPATRCLQVPLLIVAVLAARRLVLEPTTEVRP